MGADACLGQPDGIAYILHRIELQRIHTHMLTYHLDHAEIFRGVRLLISTQFLGSKVGGGDALQLFDDTTGDKFTVGLARTEVKERTAMHQRRATDTYMNLLGTIIVEHLHVVSQLGTAHDRVVAEHHFLP